MICETSGVGAGGVAAAAGCCGWVEEEEGEEEGAGTDGMVITGFLVGLLLMTLVGSAVVAISLSGMTRTGLCTSETRYWHTETAAA